MNLAHCSYIVLVIGEYTDMFREDFSSGERSVGGDYVRGSFHGGIYHGGREFS